MLCLKLYKSMELITASPLRSKLFRLGRSEDCDLILNDHCISRLHFILRQKENGWILENCSRNGIMQDGHSIEAPIFKPEIGRRYCFGKEYSFEVSNLDTPERTQIFQGRLTELVVIGTENGIVQALDAQLAPVQSPFNSRRIGSGGCSIGRHPSNDLVLDAKEISQFHARIVVEQNRFQLTDFSTNGTSVDGIRVQRASLSGEHEISFAHLKFKFFQEHEEVQIEEKNRTRFFGMSSRTKKMQRLFDLAETVATTDVPAFLQGETGTGKELLAKAIHQLSPRAAAPFVAINCAALPKELAESELFGHEKGSFTGAHQDRKGAFERAEGGSLFLDEVGELDLSLQAKLLRVLEAGEYTRVGGDRTRFTQVRIIAATHRQLEQEVEQKRFREDLFYRLKVLPFDLPPLRERMEDLPLLIDDLLNKLSPNLRISEDSIQFLKTYGFPGNIRELKNILSRALIERKISSLPISDQLEAGHFSFLGRCKEWALLQNPKERAKREEILMALEKNHFSQTRTARALKLPISTLHDRIRRYGIEVKKQSCA